MGFLRTWPAVVVGSWIAVGIGNAGAHETLPDEAFAGTPITDPGWKPVYTGVGHEPDAIPALDSPTVLFVNFDATMVNGGCGNDSTNDCSTIYSGPFVPYPGDASDRAAIVQAVREDVLDFGVIVVGERPPAGNPYAMVFVGTPAGGAPNGVGGVAPGIDCGNNNPNISSFAFLVDAGANTLATVIHQEAAHTWGLEHVDDDTDNLYPTAGGTIDPKYQDRCSRVVADTDLNPTSSSCNAIHTLFCESNFQNSYQEMLALFGPTIPDTIAPTVSIDSPADGAELDFEETFDLTITLDDDRRPQVMNTVIFIDDVEQADAVLINTTVSFPVNGGAAPEGHGLGNGPHTIRVEVTDESGNPSTDEVTITIVNGPDAPGGEDETGAGTGGDGGTAADGGTADDGGDDGDDEGGATGEGVDRGGDDEGGCACSTERASTSKLPWLWGLVLLGVRRRR
jgi:MYXO-CTERM domain-containing protein